MCTADGRNPLVRVPLNSGRPDRLRSRFRKFDGVFYKFAAMVSLVLMLSGAERVGAHPVSQGAMEVAIHPDRVEVRMTVSREEVLVAAAYRGQASLSLLERLRGHAEYLLAHLYVSVDDTVLVGRVLSLPDSAVGRPRYRFQYRLTSDVPPQNVVLSQDVLREFEFAPGNPWEASYLVRIGVTGQTPAEGLLLTYREPLVFKLGAEATADSARVLAFLRHGVMHILTGYDHLLFVAALVLGVAGLWDLVKVVTVFTLAHTITLVLSALDLFQLPSGIVEPVIAGSIVVVAVQNAWWPRQSHGRSRLLVAFLFGLFHGLGFAGGLLDAMSGLRLDGAGLAIAAFSLGVELGHQVVVLPAYGARCLLRRGSNAHANRNDRIVQRYGSVVISLAGVVYLAAALR